MAKRQDSGSSSADQNQRPGAQSEDAIPEMTETRGRAEDEYEEVEEIGEDEEEEGSF